MNSKLKGLHRDRKPHWVHRRIKGAAQWYSAGPHPVQAVRSCSWPECILLGCEGSLKAKMYAKRVEGFIANAPNKTKLGEGIKKNVALVAAMVKAHPCLKIDFQVYLRNDGAVLNIDLDRCRNTSGSVSHNDRLSWCVDKNRLENETNNDRALESPEANLSRYVNWVFGVGS